MLMCALVALFSMAVLIVTGAAVLVILDRLIRTGLAHQPPIHEVMAQIQADLASARGLLDERDWRSLRRE